VAAEAAAGTAAAGAAAAAAFGPAVSVRARAAVAGISSGESAGCSPTGVERELAAALQGAVSGLGFSGRERVHGERRTAESERTQQQGQQQQQQKGLQGSKGGKSYGRRQQHQHHHHHQQQQRQGQGELLQPHSLEIRVLPSQFIKEEFNLYCKYQVRSGIGVNLADGMSVVLGAAPSHPS
jgi:hypothetical protein